MKTCKFCGKKVKKLIDCHIQPRAFFEYSRKKANLTKKDHMAGITNTKGVFPKSKVRVGWYDPTLVCGSCETVFSMYDEYAIKLLIQEENKHKEIIIDGDLKGWEIAEFDYNKLELFMASILWRAGVTRMQQFKKIELGKKLNKIKEAILNGNAENEVSFILARFSDSLGQAFIADPHLESKGSIFYRIGVYRFYLGAGYIAFIKIGNKSFPPISSLMVANKDMPLRIITRGDFRSSDEFRVLVKIISDANLNIDKIRNNKNETK